MGANWIHGQYDEDFDPNDADQDICYCSSTFLTKRRNNSKIKG